jgi:low affinity Fe/Cu permease
MVFVIQNTQNRDGAAIQIRLDELGRAMEGANNGLLDLEEMNETEIETFRKKYEKIAARARSEIRLPQQDDGAPGSQSR